LEKSEGKGTDEIFGLRTGEPVYGEITKKKVELFLAGTIVAGILRGGSNPDLPAEYGDAPDNKNDEENRTEKVLGNIHADRDIHPHHVVEHADKKGGNKEQEETDNDSQEHRSCNAQDTWCARFSRHTTCILNLPI